MRNQDRGVSWPLLVGNVVLGAGFWAVGVSLLLDGSAGGTVAGILVLLLAVVITLAVVANLAMRRFPAGLPLPRPARRDGEDGVRIPGWGFGAAVTPVVTLFTGVAGSLLGLGALLSGQPLFGVVALGGGVYLLYVTVLVLVGRIALRQGVWLTPSQVVVSQEGATARIGWDDLAGARAQGSVCVLLSQSGSVVHRRTNAWGARRTVEEPGLLVQHGRLGVPPEGLVALVSRYAADPAARAELATEEGVRRVRAEAYDVLGGRGDSASHPARLPR